MIMVALWAINFINKSNFWRSKEFAFLWVWKQYISPWPIDIVPLRKSRSGHIVNLKKSVTVFGVKDTQEANLFMFSRIWREELRENRIQ